MSATFRFLSRLTPLKGVAVALALLAGGGVALAQTPAQKPLIKQLGELPKSNVMLTLDTSWSMIFPYMPEGDFKVGTYTVSFPGFRSLKMHPNETRYDTSSQGCGFVLPATPNATQAANRVAGNCGMVMGVTGGSNVFQKQMRSSDVNSIYYNPAVRYLPWMTTAAGGRMADANVQKALLDPTVAASGANIVDLTSTTNSLEEWWCDKTKTSGGDANCAKSTQSFNPGLYYVLKAGGNPAVTGDYTEYNINAASSTTYPKSAARTDCTGTTCNQTQERQNFANWFVFYRTRLHLAQASIPESFLPMSETFRLGWGTIHQGSSTIDNKATTIVQQGVRNATTTQKNSMVGWMRNIRSGGTGGLTTSPELQGKTPLLAALDGVGQYFSRTDADSPWVNAPGETTTGHADVLSCRRSYNILVTDGYYNDTVIPSVGNADGTSASTAITGPNPDGVGADLSYTYTAKLPYKDSVSNSLGDIAMKYWKTDLYPGTAAPNRVTASEDNPAFWQHLVQFPVGLGLFGSISWPADQAALTAGTKDWWGGTDSEDKANDMVHAAVNSRGEFFSAKDSTELSRAISSALGKAAGDPGVKEGGVATAGFTLEDGNRKYIPSYTSVKWLGDIEAYTLAGTGVAGTSVLWKASDRLPAAADRVIYTWNATTSTAVPFDWANVNLATNLVIKTAMGAQASEKLVNYLRGDKTEEGSATDKFRIREGKLPDFINSAPTLIKGNLDMNYDTLPVSMGGGTTYRTYYTNKLARRPLLFVGGNGGMLHAFRDSADTTSTVVAADDGQEAFAFVPKGVLPNLYKLSDKTYGSTTNYHQYFVDGGLAEGDFYLGAGAGQGWRNVLIGSLGGGGKGLFALNVTSTGTLGASTVMWDNTGSADNDMGYIYADAEVGVMTDGSWKVFVGNGFYSTSGEAKLLIIDVATGSVQKVATGVAGSNGLGGVRLVRNANYQVVAAYAGDLKGNLWRFELTGGDPTKWVVGFNGSPLMVAKDASSNLQPITAAPSYISHTSSGNVVLFGTGKLLEDTDSSNTRQQTMYGVWDPTVLGESSATVDTTVPANARSAMQPQIITTTPIAGTSGTRNFYSVTSNDVDWSTKKGWYMDLQPGGSQGQRVIYPTIVLGDFVYISSIVPAVTAAPCETTGGVGYNFLLNARTGGQAALPVLDTNTNGEVGTGDVAAGGFQTGADGGDTPLTKGIGKELDVSFQNTKDQQKAKLYCLVNCSKKIGDRVWRQIVSPPTP